MNKHYTLSDIAEKLSARCMAVDPKLTISGVMPLHLAQLGQLSFLANAKYRDQLANTVATAVLIDPQTAESYKGPALVVDNPYLALAQVARLFDTAPIFAPGVHAASAAIGADCHIDPSVHLASHVVLGDRVTLEKGVVIEANTVISADVVIAEDTHVKSNVTIAHGVTIGARCIVHPGAVIGSDGFGNAHHQGRWIKVPQLGGVSIGDDVEIGANTTVDRGALDDTRIGHGVRIDNLVQIAHNVVIGDHTAIAANVGIAGSTRIGAQCLIAGAVNINGHIEIADRVIVTGASSVSTSISQPGAVYSSSIPAEPAAKWRRMIGRFRHLDELAKRVKRLEK